MRVLVYERVGGLGGLEDALDAVVVRLSSDRACRQSCGPADAILDCDGPSRCSRADPSVGIRTATVLPLAAHNAHTPRSVKTD